MSPHTIAFAFGSVLMLIDAAQTASLGLALLGLLFASLFLFSIRVDLARL